MFALLTTLLLLAVSPVSSPVPAGTAAPVPPSPPPAETPKLPAWYSRLSSPTPGAFPPPRSYDASYRITWGGVEAAHVDTQIKSPPDGAQLRTSVKAATVGASRALYTLDATHLSVVDRRTFRPKFLEQTERNDRKYTSTQVDFTPEGSTRTTRDLSKAADGSVPEPSSKPRHFPYPGLFDMEGVVLYLRSQPLADGDERTLLLMTSGSPYLATIKVLGRSRVHVKAGDYPAIECSLKLEKVAKDGTLEPRKGFKSAHAWFSDDADRLLIKAQSEVFIGNVNLELEKVTFPAAAH